VDNGAKVQPWGPVDPLPVNPLPVDPGVAKELEELDRMEEDLRDKLYHMGPGAMVGLTAAVAFLSALSCPDGGNSASEPRLSSSAQ
jgi:hypothetical protein